MIEVIVRFTIFLFFFLFPVFFLSATPDFYEYNKMALFIFSTTILLLLFTLEVIQKGQILVKSASFGILLALIAGFTLVSSLFQSPNLVISLTTPLSTSTIIAGILFYFLLLYTVANNEKEVLFSTLVITALIICLYVLFLYTGVIPKDAYTPAGNLLSTTLYLTTIGVYLTTKIMVIFSGERKGLNLKGFTIGAEEVAVFYGVSLFIIAVTVIFLSIHLLTDQIPLILPFSYGWIILLDIFKNIRTLFLGVGPTNFIAAFTLAKPVSLNSTPAWNILFTSSSSFLLNLASESGLVVGMLYLVVLFKSVRLIVKNNLHNFPYILALVFILSVQIVLPASMVTFILTLILLVFATGSEYISTISFAAIGKIRYFILLPALLTAIVVFYFGGKYYLAEAYFKKSLDALLNNRGTDAYNFQLQALSFNPYIDRYHISFSQINLALANNLAAKAQLSDEDKQNIPRLTQQAINEARNAVILNRTNVLDWNNLANTYGSLINFAVGADQWAIKSHQQIIALDPLNPGSYFSFGRFYLSLKNFKEAENYLRQALSLKSDFANAHYNLSWALRQQKNYSEAYKELQITFSLLPPDSPDAKRVAEELNDLAKLVPQDEATSSAIPNNTSTKSQTIEPLPSSFPTTIRLPTQVSPIEIPETPANP